MADPIRQFLTENNIPYAETESKACWCCRSSPTKPATPSFGAPPIPGSPPGRRGRSSPAWSDPDAGRRSSGSERDQRHAGAAGDNVRIQSLSDRYAAGDVIVAEATLQPPGADGKRTLSLS